MSSSGGDAGTPPAAGERGSRRRKLAGYLKAANEMRQAYTQAYGWGSGSNGNDDYDDMVVPGAYGDVAVVQHGDEEMLLFPSYAKLHHRKGGRQTVPGVTEDLMGPSTETDPDEGVKEWEQYEDENAVIEIDVRGWIYAPTRGPMSRKNRILLGIARRLSGIPAPAATPPPGPNPQHHDHPKLEKLSKENEDAVVDKQARMIADRGRQEANTAWKGGFSEGPSANQSPQSSPSHSRASSPGPFDSIQKRESWNQPSNMSQEELALANAHLMVRLKPFMTTPLVSTPITVFFYNAKHSRSRTITTNDSGHFNLRAALDFVPTHVRVLASEKLSATEEVRIIDPHGVSLISDIDDTIKHSGITEGAREIFRNVFIRDLGDLTIDGVKEWYGRLAEMGVKMHYVSNSPWQIFPILSSYFALANLPEGSFHLKAYSGMLQGIFEPVAERKRGTLNRLLTDFPDRQFILVGDSGEADLEVYTQTLLDWPGRILAVFIRDVTTVRSRSFMDKLRTSRSPFRGRRSAGNSPVLRPLTEIKAPPLPPRNPSATDSLSLDQLNVDPAKSPAMGKLIDFDDGGSSDTTAGAVERKPVPPPRPAKSEALREVGGDKSKVQSADTGSKAAPPPPPRPRRSGLDINANPKDPSPLSQIETTTTPEKERPGSDLPSTDNSSYRESVLNRVSAAYNSLPGWPIHYSHSRSASASSVNLADSSAQGPPSPPPRRTGVAAAAAATASRFINSNSGMGNGDSPSRSAGSSRASSPEKLDLSRSHGSPRPGSLSGTGEVAAISPMLTKKEEMWRRRWEHAKETFDDKGVLLKMWRSGDDVADLCAKVVEEGLKKQAEKRDESMSR